jgi:hypothetical protein
VPKRDTEADDGIIVVARNLTTYCFVMTRPELFAVVRRRHNPMVAHWRSRDYDSVDSREDTPFPESSYPPPDLHCRWNLFACFEKEDFALQALERRQSVRKRKLVYDLEASAPSAAFCYTP